MYLDNETKRLKFKTFFMPQKSFCINGFAKTEIAIKGRQEGILMFKNITVRGTQHNIPIDGKAFVEVRISGFERGTSRVTNESVFIISLENTNPFGSGIIKYVSQRIRFNIRLGESISFKCYSTLPNTPEKNVLVEANWHITGAIDDQIIFDDSDN